MRKVEEFCNTYVLCGIIVVIALHALLFGAIAADLYEPMPPSDITIELQPQYSPITQQSLLNEQQEGFDELITVSCPLEDE